MKHLIIRNVGPIKEANVELKRFNVIIGPQSSGKSTIAKIFSTCSWIEKEVATMMNEKIIADGPAFVSLMEDFHKMEGYFDKEPEILYETDVIKISLQGKEFSVSLKNQREYRREKICYIPSERNSVTLPELQGFEFGQTNLRSFLFDWFNAREFYKEDNKAEILDLGIKYFYDPNKLKSKDRIEHVNGTTYGIALGSASSGLQSVVPLQIMMQYYAGQYFESFGEKVSFDTDVKKQKIRQRLIDSMILKRFFPEEYCTENRSTLIKKVNERLHKGDVESIELFFKFQLEMDRLTIPARTSFIVEEPEQNLYPFTQIALLEAILNLCNCERGHSCTMTTHSPFILNYLNVLIARHDKGVEGKASLDSNELGVFAIGDGRLTDLLQVNSKTGQKSVNAEDLVEAMRYMYAEYREMRM